VGFLNGVAMSIILGQADKVLGFPIHESRMLPRLIDIFGRLGETHAITFAAAAGTFLIVAGLPRLVRWMPWVLVGMILAGVSVPLFGLEASGIKTIGAVPGLPALGIPYDGIDNMPSLLADAAGSARRDRNIDNSRIGDGS
jgi:MFS superfamily sulfate permease-like transporter